MAGRLSRRSMAKYAAQRLLAGDESADVMRLLAAYLIKARRTKEAELLVRHIESTLASSGLILADITSARPISDQLREEIKSMISAKTSASTIQLRQHTDEHLLGGIVVQIPEAEFDGSLRTRLQGLKAARNQ